INATIDSMRETITTAIMVCQSAVSMEQNEINKRLAAWAGIFAVATAFVGIWGMNFQHMPELGWKYGYPLALLVITVTCGGLYYRFRRSGWL
ncbi:MAG: CorA family divalent cation transporter, partial [Gallionella sp.]|nr:CorA family divalent cation transporter [Gallionella sp.]